MLLSIIWEIQSLCYIVIEGSILTHLLIQIMNSTMITFLEQHLNIHINPKLIVFALSCSITTYFLDFYSAPAY